MVWSNSKLLRFARIGSHVVECQTPQTGLCEFFLLQIANRSKVWCWLGYVRNRVGSENYGYLFVDCINLHETSFASKLIYFFTHTCI